MKAFFFISLFLNLVMGFLYWKESTKPPLERIVVEDEPRVVEKKIFVRVPVGKSGTTESREKKTRQENIQSEGPQFTEFDQKAYEAGFEKVTTDREVYLQEKLELTPEDLQKIEKIKKEFYKDADKLIMGQMEPTIEQRRQLLDLEESREREFSRLMGKEKWEKFKKYREDYNRKNYQSPPDEQSVFIPMDI